MGAQTNPRLLVVEDCIQKIVIVSLLFFIFPGVVNAVNTSILHKPDTITKDPFQLGIAIDGANDGTNYLRADLFKEGKTEYFGETCATDIISESCWISGSDGTKYYPVIIKDASWSGVLNVRIGNPSLTEYDGIGTYKVRIRRFTTSGNYNATEANNSAVNITLSSSPENTPTMVPSETPKPSVTTKPSATPKIITPTNTPIPTMINIVKKNIDPTLTSSPRITSSQVSSRSASPSGIILGAEQVATISATTAIIKILAADQQQPNTLPHLLLISLGGLLMIISAVIIIYHNLRKLPK